MKIIKNIFFVVVLCAILLCVITLVPLKRQIDYDYEVTLYEFSSDEELQTMNAHAFGTYEYYLFHINSHSRFVGKIEITDNSGAVKLYENEIFDFHKGTGSWSYINEENKLTIVGNFVETYNPIKKGKFIMAPPRFETSLYAIYKKQ